VALDVAEYVGNLRQLLRLDYRRWRLVVDRQVLSQVLPKLKGTRAVLELHLWGLLVLCLNGHQADVPDLADEEWAKAVQAVNNGKSIDGDRSAEFLRAATGVLRVMATLRETGIYPAPLPNGEATGP